MGSHQDEDAGGQLDAAVGIYWLSAPPLVGNALGSPVGYTGNLKVVVKLWSLRVVVVVVVVGVVGVVFAVVVFAVVTRCGSSNATKEKRWEALYCRAQKRSLPPLG